MKSIMKSAFAIIAVALMIMVAVVPMVGVVTDNDSSADAISVVTPEYVTVSGKVTDSANKAIAGASITVTGASIATTVTDSTGAYSFRMVPTASAVTITASKTNEIFQTITVDKIVADRTLDFNSNMVYVTAKIQSKSGTDLPFSTAGISVSLNGSDVSSPYTGINGQISFYAKIGDVATISGSTTAYNFTVASDSKYEIKATNSIVVKMTQDVMVVTLAPAIYGQSISAAATTSAKTSIASSATTDLDGKAYFAYTTTGTTSEEKEVKFNATVTNFGTIVEAKTQVSGAYTYTLSNAGATTGTTVPCKYISGNVKVDNVAVTGGTVTLSYAYKKTSDSTESTGTITATPDAKGNYYLGLYIADIATVTPVSFKATLTYADGSTLFNYNEMEITSYATVTGKNFTAQNAVKISGNTGYALTSLTLTGTYFIGGVIATGSTITAGLDGSYAFYIKSNDTTGVTITAPAGTYTPASYTYKDLFKDQVADFTPIVNNTYTVSFALNGVPLYLAGISGLSDKIELVDENKTSFSSAIKATFTALYNEATITVPSTVDVSKCYLKVDNDLAGYYFGSADAYYAFEDGMVVDVVKKSVTITAKDANGNALTGAEVTLSFAKGTSVYDAVIIEELGKATINAKGTASIYAALPSTNDDGYIVVAKVSGKATVGDYTFGTAGKSSSSALVDRTAGIVSAFAANEKTTYGTVIDSYGNIVANPEISYVAYNSTVIIGEGKATVVDGKYYIISKDATKFDVKVKGYGNSQEVIVGIDKDLTVTADTPASKTVSVSGLYSNYVKVSTSTGVKGDVITFSAVSEYTVEDSKNQYTDGYTKYTFKAWYVNGKQVSTDAVTSYTIGDESIVVSADYTVEHVTTGEVKVEEKQGVDSTVLVIGIAAVVIALIAVIYAVIQRKN